MFFSLFAMNIVAYIHVHSCIEQSGPKTLKMCSFAPAQASTQRTDAAWKTCFRRQLQTKWTHTENQCTCSRKTKSWLEKWVVTYWLLSTKGAVFIYEWHFGKEARPCKKRVGSPTTSLPCRLNLCHMAWVYCGISSIFCFAVFLTSSQPSQAGWDFQWLLTSTGDDWPTLASCYSQCCFNSTMSEQCWPDKLKPKRRVGWGAQHREKADRGA